MTDYEFTAPENETIGRLAKNMRFVAIVQIVFGIILIGVGIRSLPTGLGSVIQGVIMILIAAWTLKAANAFKQIVATEGSDIGNLMEALRQLGRLFMFQVVLFIILVAFVGLAVIVAVGSETRPS